MDSAGHNDRHPEVERLILLVLFRHLQFDQRETLEKALLCCPGNEEQVKRSFQVYMDLLEAKTWHDVELHHCKALTLMFVSARRGQGQPRDIFLPTDVDSEVSHDDIQNYFSCLTVGERETTSVTLAVCDCDTSTVYYRLSNSLLPPDPPNITDEKKGVRHMRLQNRKQHLAAQTELFRVEKERSIEMVDAIDDY